MKHVHRRSARLAAAAAALVVTAGALAGCSSSGGGEETVVIKVAIQQETGAQKPYETVFAQIEDMYPNIDIQASQYAADQLGTVMTTQLQAGNAPDLIWGSPGTGNTNSLGLYAQAGYLVDLSDQDWAVESITESAKPLFYNGDELFALPLDLAPIPMIINSTAYEAAGLTPATTFDGVLEDCAVARESGASLLNVAGAFAPQAGITALELAATRVYRENPNWNQDRADGKTTFAETKGWKDTLNAFITLHENQCFQDGVEGADGPQLFGSVASGQSLGTFVPAGAINDLRSQETGAEFALALFPGETEDDAYLFASPTDAFGLNAASTHPEEAMQVLEAFATPEIRDALAELTGNVSMETALNGQPATGDFESLNDLLSDPDRNGPLANLFWPNGEVYSTLGTGVQGLLTGQVTVDALLEELDKSWG
ncbi:MAG TPA: ABC transporter substrate-binding protein [Microbacterium sp.]|uniref:ABC transporter substrate-binding protein n=1 Tax=Microbacterium sp. TaxID=51671 RepID=UPI002BF0E199|nr:ABC transporter substrate-binding protein [Microbacterium sp.]HWI30207.1 ABC transporter substrate-binding protein [Microbacterium sp.]